MSEDKKPDTFKRMSFKGNKVWAQTDGTGEFKIINDKVLIKYNLKQDYEYQVNPNSLNPEDQAIPAKKKGSTKKEKTDPDVPENCIKIYTDGASSGNPGPAGIGALLIYKENKKEISQYIGKTTNNIAELTAIKVALLKLKRNDLPVRIFSDSSYAIGLLTQKYKPKKNQELVNEIKKVMGKFLDLAFIKVKGHAGIKENEVADYLATSAIKKRP